jgi:polyferredoxin
LVIIPLCIYYAFPSPVIMVKIGGTAQALMLPVIAIGALFLRHKRLPVEVAPGRKTTAALWAAAAITIALMVYYAILTAMPSK